MAAKKKVPPQHICYLCGKVISGDHVYIKTKRGSDLYIHHECMNNRRTGQ